MTKQPSRVMRFLGFWIYCFFIAFVIQTIRFVVFGIIWLCVHLQNYLLC